MMSVDMLVPQVVCDDIVDRMSMRCGWVGWEVYHALMNLGIRCRYWIPVGRCVCCLAHELDVHSRLLLLKF